MTLSRADRQTAALVLLLKALPEQQLIDVCAGIGATLDLPTPADAPRRRGKPCFTCGLIYPMHMARWGEDHPFESHPRQRATDAAPEDGDD